MDYKVLPPKILIKKIEKTKEGIVSATEDNYITGKVIEYGLNSKLHFLRNKIVIVHRKYVHELPDDKSLYVIHSDDILTYY